MRSILALALLALPNLYGGPVSFSINSIFSSLRFANGTSATNANNGTITLSSTLPGAAANQAFFFLELTSPSNLAPPPPALAYGSLIGGPWTVSNYQNSMGVETADLTGSSTMFLYNASNTSGAGVKASLTLDRIQVDNNASGTLKAGVNINIGPWQEIGAPGSASAELQQLLSATPSIGVATISFDLNTSSLAALMFSTTGNSRIFDGNVNHVPEPGFYGVLAGGLGALVWAFRRRKSETA